ncbi:MAG TPA: Glu/Leu/Phe/Val dehydrogenase family protein [Synergistaceae bacterium]|nr:Glu/Leu/Phe/Val dehydrogenase family protein [Synergistaceae bacterium]
MEKSLFIPLRNEGLTTMRIRYDFKTGAVRLYAAKEWEKDFDFSQYNRAWWIDGIFTEDAKYLNTREVWALFEKHGQKAYLEEVLDLLRAGKHFGIDLFYYAKYDIRYMMHEHSRKLGLHNKSHAIMAGGIRRHSYDEEELDVIIDGLNLGRGMSFKNIAGHLPFGGCKATVTMAPLDLENMEVMGFLAFALDSCRDMTGPDMNFPTEMSDVMIREGYSMQFTGGPAAKTGETGKPTAYGVYLALLEAVKFHEGKPGIKGKTAAVMGLGAVGWYMGEHLLEGGVSELVVADINPDTVRRFIAAHPGYNIVSCPVSEVLFRKVDILSPCAIGGIFDESTIAKLNCTYIFGSSNNGLKASSQEEEIRLAKLIADRGIVYQVEWWHNTAGVICGAEEYLFDGTEESLRKKIEAIMPANTIMSLQGAKEQGITPTEFVYRHCEDLLYK